MSSSSRRTSTSRTSSSKAPSSKRDLTSPPWTYRGEVFDPALASEYEAFVYRITRLSTGRVYWGKKVFHRKITRPPLKGQKRKRHERVPSDWREYWGSNHVLQNEIEELGTSDFVREIVHLCQTRGEASYLEAKEQFANDVLASDDFYNDQIRVRVHRSHLPREKK